MVALQHDMVRMQRQRDYWVAYQQQTAMEAGRAQEIMVHEIDSLRKKLGEPEDSTWLDSVKKWETRRVRSEGSHPFSASFGDVGSDVSSLKVDLTVVNSPTK